MHGERKTHELMVSIQDKVNKLVEMLQKIEPTETESYHVITFIYPMGKLRQLEMAQTFEQQSIPSGAKFVLLGSRSFKWNLNKKGTSMQLSNEFLTVYKRHERKMESVLAT